MLTNNLDRMRMRIALWVISLLSCSAAWAGTGNGDEILGKWLNASGRGQIEIYKEGNLYFGKLVWLREPNDENGMPKLDRNNPKKTEQGKPLLGALILRGFKQDGKEWNGGYIYDPQNGKDYKCFLKLQSPNELKVRGYIGVSLLGRTEVWTRIK
jgi:uncharacterized protein (DUF2147 family)